VVSCGVRWSVCGSEEIRKLQVVRSIRGHCFHLFRDRATSHERRSTQHVARDLWLAKGIPGVEDLLVSSEDRVSIVGQDVRFKKTRPLLNSCF
jgi:hypothetical protein